MKSCTNLPYHTLPTTLQDKEQHSRQATDCQMVHIMFGDSLIPIAGTAVDLGATFVTSASIVPLEEHQCQQYWASASIVPLRGTPIPAVSAIFENPAKASILR
eukprot:c31281_g1_i1 orf=1-309(+)